MILYSSRANIVLPIFEKGKPIYRSKIIAQAYFANKWQDQDSNSVFQLQVSQNQLPCFSAHVLSCL